MCQLILPIVSRRWDWHPSWSLHIFGVFLWSHGFELVSHASRIILRESTRGVREAQGTGPKKRENHVTRCNTVGLYKIIKKQHVYVKDQSAQRPMQTAWYIYKRASYIDGSYSQNRRATPQFVAIECVFILLQDSFPAWPQVIDTTFG